MASEFVQELYIEQTLDCDPCIYNAQTIDTEIL